MVIYIYILIWSKLESICFFKSQYSFTRYAVTYVNTLFCIVYMFYALVVNLPFSSQCSKSMVFPSKAPGNGFKFTCPERRVVPSWTAGAGGGLLVLGSHRGAWCFREFLERGKSMNQPPPIQWRLHRKDVECPLLSGWLTRSCYPASMAKTWVNWLWDENACVHISISILQISGALSPKGYDGAMQAVETAWIYHSCFW